MKKDLKTIEVRKEAAREVFLKLCSEYAALKKQADYPVAVKSYSGKFFKQKVNTHNKNCDLFRYTAIMDVREDGKMEVFWFNSRDKEGYFYIRHEISGWEYTPKGGLFGKEISKAVFVKAQKDLFNQIPKI